MVANFCCTALIVVVTVIVLLVLYLGRRRIGRRVRRRRERKHPYVPQYPPSAISTGHCPSCGAPTIWDVSKRRYQCPGCGKVV